jgi:hypothetical protein
MTTALVAGGAAQSALARRALVNWCRRQALGAAAATAAHRLIRPAPPPLDPALERDLADALRDSHPADHGLTGELWSRDALGELIHRRYGVRLTPRGLNRQLRAWGLGPRTPAERACARCVGAVVSWLTRAYPEIVRRARAAGAQVCWAGRVQPAAPPDAPDGGPGLAFLTAVTSRGGLRFAAAAAVAGEGPPLPGAFLSRLAAHEGREVHVIVDGSVSAADWPAREPSGIVLHPMPCCARGTAR